MQRERRRDPYPWTWELPLAAALVVVVVIVAGIQLGRTVANLLAGAGCTWPASDATTGTGVETGSPIGTAFWTSLPGVVGGDSAAGLSPGTAPSDGLADPGLLWASVTATELILLTLTAWAGIWLYLRWGPGRMRGMATVAEAEKLLGVTRLREVAPIVRPDRYGRHADAGPPVHRTADLRGESGVHERRGSPIGGGLATPWLRSDRVRTGRRTKGET